MNRTQWLAVLFFGILGIVLLSKWIGGWGLITLEGKDLRLGDVLKSMSRQSGAEILSNIDPETKVSVEFHRATLPDAMETLAVRTDANWSGGWIAAPDKAAIAAYKESFAKSERTEGWKTYNYSFMGGAVFSATPLDPRKMTVTLSAMDTNDLGSAFNQIAQKTGVRFMMPEAWNPALSKMPKGGSIGKLVPSLAKAGKGVASPVIFLTQFRRNRGQQAGGGERNFKPNPEWIQERVQQAIAVLPPEERAPALEAFQEQRQLWTSLRNLPQEERRAKIEEYMNRPDVQDRIEQMSAQRDSRRTPEQRLQRYRNYVKRKDQQKNKQ